MESGESSKFSQLLLETLQKENVNQDERGHVAAHPDTFDENVPRSSFEKRMHFLLENNLPLRLAQSQMECQSTVNEQDDQKQNVEGIKRTNTHTDDGIELEHYHDFLCQVSALGALKCISHSEIEKTTRSPYGAGASMTVYPGHWSYAKDDGGLAKKVVAIKYCNITPPQGASSLRDCKEQISSRLKSVLYELEVMSSWDTRHSDIFPEVYAMSWEDCQTPAGITIYQPVLIVEPAIATLEEYICNGWPTSVVRHEAERRFIVSLHSAMSYLHAHCGIVHGDLKPGNILVFVNRYSGEIQAKLSDFGLAFPMYGSEMTQVQRDDWRPLGTRYWSAPEMCIKEMWLCGSRINPYEADYYSFGLIVWFILFGYPVSESKKVVNKRDEDQFMAMKSNWDTKVQDHFEQAFNRRWRWKVSSGCAKVLKNSKDPKRRKRMMSVFIKMKQVQEQEYDENSKTWISTKSQLHHAYRGLVRKALSWYGNERIYPCALPTNRIFERTVAETLSTNHICGDLDYPTLDFDYSAEAARRYIEKRLGSQLYARQMSEKSKRAKARLMTLKYSIISPIPEALGHELTQFLVSRASDETRPQEERVRDMNGIQNLARRFPSDVDVKDWERRMVELAPSIHRLKYVYEQGVLNEPVDKDLATAWILDGLSSSLTEQIDDKVQKVLSGIPHHLAETPAQIACTDWMSEIGIRRRKQRPEYKDIDQHPIFQSVLQEDLPKLHDQLTNSKTRPSKLRYRHYNLLSFAMINRQPRICRYLCLEHNFEFSYENGGDEALDDVMSDTSETILLEFDSFAPLVHEKWLSIEPRNIDKKPMSLTLHLLYPPALAILVQTGTASAIELVHSMISDPLALHAKIIHLNWIEQFQDEEELNPLLKALSTRRLTPFLRLLQMGQPHRAVFPPDSIVLGLPMLFYAVDSLAPFFVAALLAHGADANTLVDMGGGFKVNALHILCANPSSTKYEQSLRLRMEFHKECGFDEYIIDRDMAEIESVEEDAISQRILIAELLISHGVDVNAQSVVVDDEDDGIEGLFPETPLSLCISSGNVELASFLIQKGADLSIPVNSKTPIYQAIQLDNVEMVRMLLEHAPLANSLHEGLSPLTFATLFARREIFKLLLEKGADLAYAPDTGGILFHQILEMTSELFCGPEAVLTGFMSTLEDRMKLRPVLADHLKTLEPADLKRLMQLESEDGAIAIHHAARWITGLEEGDADLLNLIMGNTDDLFATLKTGQNAGVLGVALGNLGFCVAWNHAYSHRV
ncbi:serine threonine kinase [Fusarium longipes]|uniref:Autophagy-related protein 1 n=1 Tax=Fusarium longipes TaxID=694270 RepID=A0A395T5I6_9HYPO|nr:serine threonine kinase [Fusarium longipes]